VSAGRGGRNEEVNLQVGFYLQHPAARIIPNPSKAQSLKLVQSGFLSVTCESQLEALADRRESQEPSIRLQRTCETNPTDRTTPYDSHLPVPILSRSPESASSAGMHLFPTTSLHHRIEQTDPKKQGYKGLERVILGSRVRSIVLESLRIAGVAGRTRGYTGKH
jgi:hypothetical protein